MLILNNNYQMLEKYNIKDLLYLFGIISVFIYFQFWFFGINVPANVVDGYFLRSSDFFFLNAETKSQLISNPGSVNHFPAFIGYFFKLFLGILGIEYTLGFFIFLSFIPYVIFFFIVSYQIYMRINLISAIIITSGLISTSISTYMYSWAGMIDGFSYLFIFLIYLAFEKRNWKNVILFTILGILSHQLVFISFLLMFSIFFFFDLFVYKDVNSKKNIITLNEKKLSRKERLSFKKIYDDSFFSYFQNYIKSLATILFFWLAFQILNYIFLPNGSGSYLSSAIDIKNTIVSGIGNTPLNIFTTLKFMLIPIFLLIYWQFRNEAKFGFLLLLPVFFSFFSIIIWSDTTRIMMHFIIILFFISLNLFFNKENVFLLKKEITTNNKKIFLNTLIICSIINIITPSFIINNNSLITYSRLSIEEKDQFGNVSASYSSLENQNEVRWSDSDGNLYVKIDKHDYLFFYCTKYGYGSIHSGGIYPDSYNEDWLNKSLTTNCIYYVKTFNFLENKWRLFGELED